MEASYCLLSVECICFSFKFGYLVRRDEEEVAGDDFRRYRRRIGSEDE